MLGGAQALAISDMDAIVSQIPLDPFITLGLMTFSCGGLGWLLGPIVGTGVFNLTNSKYKGEIIVKEKEFYDRVKRFRVDPSASSMANPGSFPHYLISIVRLGNMLGYLLTYDSSRLLRRENWKCSGLQTMAKGPARVQQEAADIFEVDVGYGTLDVRLVINLVSNYGLNRWFLVTGVACLSNVAIGREIGAYSYANQTFSISHSRQWWVYSCSIYCTLKFPVQRKGTNGVSPYNHVRLTCTYHNNSSVKCLNKLTI
jgi:hypothetical protein